MKVRHKETGIIASFSKYNYHGVGEFIAIYEEGDASSEYVRDYYPIDEDGNIIDWPQER